MEMRMRASAAAAACLLIALALVASAQDLHTEGAGGGMGEEGAGLVKSGGGGGEGGRMTGIQGKVGEGGGDSSEDGADDGEVMRPPVNELRPRKGEPGETARPVFDDFGDGDMEGDDDASGSEELSSRSDDVDDDEDEDEDENDKVSSDGDSEGEDEEVEAGGGPTVGEGGSEVGGDQLEALHHNVMLGKKAREIVKQRQMEMKKVEQERKMLEAQNQMKKPNEKKNVPKTKHFNEKGEPIPVINELGVTFDMVPGEEMLSDPFDIPRTQSAFGQPIPPKPTLPQHADEGGEEARDLHMLGVRLRTGVNGTKVDFEGAWEAFEKAAEMGSMYGKTGMGEMLKLGEGRLIDHRRAVALFNESASKGNPSGHRHLAMCYSTGLCGLVEDQALAILHYHFAAIGGDLHAHLALGYRHMHGGNVPKSCNAAVMYYSPAAEHVVRLVQSHRGPGSIERLSIAPTLGSGGDTPSLGLDDDVVDYYHYSATRGDPGAQVSLGQLYYYGARGLREDVGEAFKWYTKAAEQGDATAMGYLGNMYAQGVHVKADNATAVNWYRMGMDKSNPVALNGFGYMCMRGMGVPQSYPEALKHFTAAAEQGNQEARFNLGAMYIGGHGVVKDFAKAIYYFTLAANRGHMLALYNLAMMHLNGFGTPRSCTNALTFLKNVAERGEWGGSLQKAYKLYKKGEIDRSLLLYSELAEMGYDVAQGNTAHLLDKGSTPFTSGMKHKALKAYELSAQQGSMDSELKIGDYYFHGWGTAKDVKKAVVHYRVAAEARVAQAMFNLGWMHEHGVGIPQDLHLAKRYYDMSVETSADAIWPVVPCLMGLWMRLWALDAIDAMDRWSTAFNQHYARTAGFEIPESKAWMPYAKDNWDVVLVSVLIGMLGATMMLKLQVMSLRRAARNRRFN